MMMQQTATMNSQEIQTAVYRWAINNDFTAPYGVLTGEHTNTQGRRYRSVTFGLARTLDCEVQVHNRHFIVVRTNQHGSQVFRSYQDCQAFLDTL